MVIERPKTAQAPVFSRRKRGHTSHVGEGDLLLRVFRYEPVWPAFLAGEFWGVAGVAMLDLNGVSHRTGREVVLDEASLRFEPGRICVVLIPSGPGRQGLLRLLAGQDRPDKGSVRFGTEDASSSKALKSGVAHVRKFGAEPTGRKVRALVHQAARRGGMASRAADVEVSRAATAAGLAGRLETRVRDLDLEDRVRLQLAMAAAQKPKLLLLDEPLADLQGEARSRLLVDLVAMLGVSDRVVIVYVTASPAEARAIGGDLAVIDRGRISQAGPVADVLDHPRDLGTARAISFPRLNLVAVARESGACRLADGSTFAPPPGIALPPEGGFTIAFRPADASASRSNERCIRFLARGEGAETVSGMRFARVGFAGMDWLVTLPATGDPAPGVMTNVFVDRDKVMVFDADGRAVDAALPKRAAG